MVNPAPSRRNTLVGVGAGVVGGVALLSLVAVNMHPARPAVLATPTIAATTPAPAPVSTATQPASVTPSVVVTSASVTPRPTTNEDDESDGAESTRSASPKPSKSPSKSADPSDSSELSNGAVVTSLDEGSYVTVFKWMSKKTTTAAEAASYAESQAGKGGHNPVAIDGDAVPGMNPGFWGIGVPGAKTFTESRQVCVELGFAPNGSKCWARLVK